MTKKSNKTRKLIEDTFIDLMVKTDFNKISITDITDALDINRGTFYIHYKDKYDLLEQKENEVLADFNDIFSKISEALPQDTIFPASQEVLMKVLTNVYTYVYDNSKFMKVILGPNGDYSFQIKIANLLESILMKHLSTTSILKSNINYKYVTTIASSAQLSIVQKWLKTDMEETPSELAAFVSSVINSLYLGLLKRELP